MQVQYTLAAGSSDHFPVDSAKKRKSIIKSKHHLYFPRVKSAREISSGMLRPRH